MGTLADMVIAACEERGIVLAVAENRRDLRVTQGTLTPAIRDALKADKAAVILRLRLSNAATFLFALEERGEMNSPDYGRYFDAYCELLRQYEWDRSGALRKDSD